MNKIENRPGWNTLWPAPAKINRFLHIIGQRNDGYHTIQSVFQYIDLSDQLLFEPRNDNKIIISPEIPGVENQHNLIFQAAESLRQKARINTGVNIKLEKNIPLGAGLGGGSSDAATTLLALNNLWQLNYSEQQLAQLALKLGADVPFFIYGKNALVEGIGEKITPISIDTPVLLLQTPNCAISTQNIFQDPDLNRQSPEISIVNLELKRNKLNNIIELNDFGYNDCEATVRQKFPQVDEAFSWISNIKPTRLTGTGSCVFTMFDNSEEAGKIALRCPESIQHLVTKTLQQSPLKRLLR